MNRNVLPLAVACGAIWLGFHVSLEAAEAELVREESENVSAWSAQVVQRHHGPRESDAILIDIFLVQKGNRRLLAKNIIGPVFVFENERKLLSCESQGSAMVGRGPIAIGLDGRKMEGPKHPGYLRECARVERSDLLILHYNLVKDGKPYNLSRVLDTDGKIVQDNVLYSAGEFSVTRGGKTYRLRVPEPDLPG